MAVQKTQGKTQDEKLTPIPGRQTDFLGSTVDRVFFGGARGGSKAQPLDSIIVTPFGLKTMGEMQVGSTILNPDGSHQKVIAVHPQGMKPVYRLTFIDGAQCEATDEHLWLAHITCKKQKAKKSYMGKSESLRGKIYTTKYLYDFIQKKKKSTRKHINNQNILVPLPEAAHFTVSYKTPARPLHPYLLGVLLGDGCISQKTSVTYSSSDPEISKRLAKLGYDIKYLNRLTYRVYGKEVKDALSKLKLTGSKSYNKYIPREYLLAPVEDRMELLRGLMDTDGSVDERGHLSFCSTSEKLAKDVQFLVRSLGGKATDSINISTYCDKGGQYVLCNPAHILYINFKNSKEVFSLKRKRDRCTDTFNGGVSELKNRIVDIEYIGEKESQCITVDHPNGLYMTNDFIVTHNSFALVWDAALKVREFHYEYKNKRLTDDEVREFRRTGKLNKAKFIVDRISIDYPEYTAQIVRKTHPQLEKHIRPHCEIIYRKFGAIWQERHHCYKFPSGARIYLGHCKDRKALDDYIGGNYHYLGIDEANQFPKDWVDQMISSVRSANKNLHPYVRLTSNPGNIGHKWLKETFVDQCPPINDGPVQYNKEYDISYQPKRPNKPIKDENGISFQYIPATVFDNPYLLNNDPIYVKTLKGYNKKLRAMWLEGRWDVFSGMYFDNWNETHHIIPQKDFKFGKNFSKDTHTLYRFYDYGTKAPFVCLLVALDKNGYMTVFDEIVETGLAASKQVKLVNGYCKEKYGLEPDDFALDIADPAYWTKQSEKEGVLYSPADFYYDGGIYLVPGNNDRAAGAKVVYDALELPENAKQPEENLRPRVVFTDNCKYCIETIPTLPSDEHDEEKVDTEGEDHAYDALRYGCMHILTYYIQKDKESKHKSWRDKVGQHNPGNDDGNMWKVA